MEEDGRGLTIKVKVGQKKEKPGAEAERQGKEMRPNSGVVLPNCRGEAKPLGWGHVASSGKAPALRNFQPVGEGRPGHSPPRLMFCNKFRKERRKGFQSARDVPRKDHSRTGICEELTADFLPGRNVGIRDQGRLV